MSTKEQLERRCEALGCTLADNGCALEIFAPAGYRIAAGQVHMLRIDYDTPRGAWHKPDAYAALLADLAMGLESCNDPACDCCAGR